MRQDLKNEVTELHGPSKQCEAKEDSITALVC